MLQVLCFGTMWPGVEEPIVPCWRRVHHAIVAGDLLASVAMRAARVPDGEPSFASKF
mgnify:FL=1